MGTDWSGMSSGTAEGGAVLFGLGQLFSFSYGACGLVNCHLVVFFGGGGLVMIFEMGYFFPAGCIC